MRQERRSLPSLEVTTVTITASLVLVVDAAVFPPTFKHAGYVWAELGIVVIAAVIAAHAEIGYGRARTVILTAVLAYLGTRALDTGFMNPGSLQSWLPYPLSSWLWRDWQLLLAIFLQVVLLCPLVPVLVQDGDRVRKPLALLLCLVVFAGWDWLSGAVGSASAGLICALALLLMTLLAADRAFMLFGIVACAGFLALSALVQQPRSTSAVVRELSRSAAVTFPGPYVDFSIAPSAGVNPGTNGLTLEILLQPASPTLFGCPKQVDMKLELSGLSRRAQNPFLHSAYEIDITGATQITDLRAGASGSSQVIYTPEYQRSGGPLIYDATPKLFGGTHTQWRGTGLYPYPDSSGDVFEFSLPLQSWRSMGTCYVGTPVATGAGIWNPPSYSETLGKETVGLALGPGETLDLTDTAPQPEADPNADPALQYEPGPWAPGPYDWTCYDESNAQVSVKADCPVVAVVAANWADSYTQVAMVGVGALIAIAAERWFHRVQDDKDKEPADGAEPVAADGGAGDDVKEQPRPRA